MQRTTNVRAVTRALIVTLAGMRVNHATYSDSETRCQALDSFTQLVFRLITVGKIRRLTSDDLIEVVRRISVTHNLISTPLANLAETRALEALVHLEQKLKEMQ
jgi:hypothetical protein